MIETINRLFVEYVRNSVDIAFRFGYSLYIDNAHRKQIMTLIQAQQKYIDRVNACDTGHVFRVRRSAYKELYTFAEKHGFDAKVVCKDAKDVAALECAAEE